ncbi:MAG TPA: tetratricopeptide repeat protein, partial [Saprospiraceae bacterium]|nr:tetratricopeptide repeat protein [Saprospiraceae bacterium]
MSNLIKKFNPLEMEESDVLALSTGREPLLKTMLKEMDVCLKNGSNQHYILYGPRGIGKSFFTRLLKIHHDKSSFFKNSLFIQLSEEQDNINFAADLLDVISIILEGGQLADANPKWSITTHQWEASLKRLKTALIDIKREKNIDHVFVTQENLQVFIPKLNDIESSRLRTFLSDFDEITLIGSSLRPDLDNDYSKRLFQVFKKMDIEPWSSEDFLSYYKKKASLSHNNLAQFEQIKKSKNKIKAIAKFTGGSPRLAVILSNLILDKNILDTAQLLDGIIDDLTSYYQDITNDIPPKSKILFDMLIRIGENITQSALAESFDPPLDQSTIARSFSWLIDNYYVVSKKQTKGNTKYFYVRDRLYVLYYQKRQIYADVPYSFIGVFVDFLAEFYTQNEQKQEITKLNLTHPFSKPLLYHFAKKANLIIDNNYEPKFIKEQLLSSYYKVNKKKASDDWSTLFLKGSDYANKGDFENAIKAYEKAITLNPDDASAYYNLGNSYANKGDFENAIKAYEKAITLNPDNASAYYNLGISYGNKDDFENAIKAYEKAITLNPDDASAYYN